MLGAAAFALLATLNAGGYRYGVGDQAVYIPAILRAPRRRAVPARRRAHRQPVAAVRASTSCWRGPIGARARRPRGAVPRRSTRSRWCCSTPALVAPRRAACSSRAGRSPPSSRVAACAIASPRPAPTRSKATSIRACSRSPSACSASARCCAARPWTALGRVGRVAGARASDDRRLVRRSGSASRSSSNEPRLRPAAGVGGAARRRGRRGAALLGAVPARSIAMDAAWMATLAGKDYVFADRLGRRAVAAEPALPGRHRRHVRRAARAAAWCGPAKPASSPAASRWSRIFLATPAVRRRARRARRAAAGVARVLDGGPAGDALRRLVACEAARAEPRDDRSRTAAAHAGRRRGRWRSSRVAARLVCAAASSIPERPLVAAVAAGRRLDRRRRLPARARRRRRRTCWPIPATRGATARACASRPRATCSSRT